jgi:hypothetical protein
MGQETTEKAAATPDLLEAAKRASDFLTLPAQVYRKRYPDYRSGRAGGEAENVGAILAAAIAAGPDMLAVCKETLDQMEDRYDGAPDSPTLWMGRHIDRLRAVIARATGEGE